jgi:hypothetical protein
MKKLVLALALPLALMGSAIAVFGMRSKLMLVACETGCG